MVVSELQNQEADPTSTSPGHLARLGSSKRANELSPDQIRDTN